MEEVLHSQIPTVLSVNLSRETHSVLQLFVLVMKLSPECVSVVWHLIEQFCPMVGAIRLNKILITNQRGLDPFLSDLRCSSKFGSLSSGAKKTGKLKVIILLDRAWPYSLNRRG